MPTLWVPGSHGKAPALWVSQGGSIRVLHCRAHRHPGEQPQGLRFLPPPNTKEHFPFASSSSRASLLKLREILSSSLLKKAKPPTRSYYQIPSCQRKQQSQVAIGLCFMDFHNKSCGFLSWLFPMAGSSKMFPMLFPHILLHIWAWLISLSARLPHHTNCTRVAHLHLASSGRVAFTSHSQFQEFIVFG